MTMKASQLIFGIILLALVPSTGVRAATPSALWGNDGSAWTPASRLPDFSFAGYHGGGVPPPSPAVAASVKDFGAAGDGRTDDAEAFRKAIAATAKGVIQIPAGRYVLKSQVALDKGGVVLRGAGIGKTVLVVPQSLEQIHGARPVDKTKSQWAFSGGFIELKGSVKSQKLAEVAIPAKRGDCRLELKQAAGLVPGAWVRLLMNNDPELGRVVHAGQAEAAETTRREVKNFCDRVVQVVAVEGKTITIDRPLRLEVRPEWQAEIWSWKPQVEESGIESLSFEFAGTPKRPHLQEEGFNAIQMHNVANCWVRDIELVDADNGVIASNCRFCTIAGLRARAVKREGKSDTGHHAMWATGKSQDCLFTGFRLETRYVHDLTVEGGANGNVFERGQGVSIDFDHHSNAPYENLFTELDVGSPRRLWNCGGRQDRGPHTGARTTFWNIAGKPGEKPPAVPDWPQINVIGLSGCQAVANGNRQWIETCADGVTPPNLYRAQLQRRLGQKNPATPATTVPVPATKQKDNHK
jgi:hypothetical protein